MVPLPCSASHCRSSRTTSTRSRCWHSQSRSRGRGRTSTSSCLQQGQRVTSTTGPAGYLNDRSTPRPLHDGGRTPPPNLYAPVQVPVADVAPLLSQYPVLHWSEKYELRLMPAPTEGGSSSRGKWGRRVLPLVTSGLGAGSGAKGTSSQVCILTPRLAVVAIPVHIATLQGRDAQRWHKQDSQSADAPSSPGS